MAKLEGKLGVISGKIFEKVMGISYKLGIKSKTSPSPKLIKIPEEYKNYYPGKHEELEKIYRDKILAIEKARVYAKRPIY